MSKFNENKLIRTDLYITKEQNTFLDNYREKLNMSKSQVMRIALQEFMIKNSSKDIISDK